jgi:O-antigen ligase
LAVSQRVAARNDRWLLSCGLVVIASAGALLTLTPPWPAILLGVAVAGWSALLLYRLAGASVFAVEVPLLLLLLSTFTWRARTANDLAAAPLDGAGSVRVGLLALGGLFGLAAVLSVRAGRSSLPIPWRLYGGYMAVVVLGVPLSAHPALTAYRALELAVGLLVLVGAVRAAGVGRIQRVVYWFIVGYLVVIWVEAAVFPSLAFQPLASRLVPVGVQLSGVYPSVSANTVGALGVLLVCWTLARSGQPCRRMMVILGLVSLLASQYRTGYLAVSVAVMLWLLMCRRWGLLALLILVACWVALWKPSVFGTVGMVVLRGDTLEQARGLNSRVGWWEAALPVWQESPLIGRGLLTATRFEVLAQLGATGTSTIHGTWVEALVGTGILGCGLLALSYLSAVRRARGALMLVLVVLGVRSLTGQTFESFGLFSLVFLVIAAGPSPVVTQTEQLGAARGGEGDAWPVATPVRPRSTT